MIRAANSDITANDGTASASDTATGDVTAFAARWDDTSSGEMQVGFRTGVDTWAWGTASSTYDGGFASDAKLHLLYNIEDAANVANFDLYDTDEGTTWIEDNYPASVGFDETIASSVSSSASFVETYGAPAYSEVISSSVTSSC